MLKKIYSCDICGERKELNELTGLKFTNNTNFVFSEPRATDGKHICESCINILIRELKKPTVKPMDSFTIR